MNAPVLPPALLAITPGAGDGADLLRRLERALAAGLRGVLLREPDLADGAFLELARALRARLAAPGTWLGLHDRAHLVHAAGADGLHLGFRSLPPDEARRVVGESVALGLSTHVGEDRGAFESLDYRTFGPVRATPSKAGRLEPTGVPALAREAAAGGPPIWALGGLTPADVAACRAAGARGVAAINGLLGAADPASAVSAFRAAFEEVEE